MLDFVVGCNIVNVGVKADRMALVTLMPLARFRRLG